MLRIFKGIAAAFLSAVLVFSEGCTAQMDDRGISQSGSEASTQMLSNNNIASGEIEHDDVCDVEIGSEVYISRSGADYRSGVLSILKGGTYRLSGEIKDGYVYIDTDDNVKLILNGFSAVNGNGAALYCHNAENLCLELAEGSVNRFEDGSNYTFTGENQSSENNEPNAAVYSKSDMIICGGGNLEVVGNYALGIRCNDDLTIESGNIDVTSVTNGIRGTDSLVVEGGNITVNAGKDGLKSTNDSDSDKGYVLISGGNISVAAVEDGIQAENRMSVTGGFITVSTTGDVASSENGGGGGPAQWLETGSGLNDDATAKGIKSGGALSISGGEIVINSTDHCIHSASSIDITDGKISLSSSKGKGVSAHGALTVDGGDIEVINSFEGLESKSVFTVNDGNITVNASDDGFNSGGGSDRFGFDTEASAEGEHDMFINGGYIFINAGGDGIDSNGNITVNGGTVIVNGPVSGMDGALDCGDRNNTITINGGFLVAVGSRQMAEAPHSSSTQNSLSITADVDAGETFALRSKGGENIAVFTVAKQTQHIVISSPEIKNGETYDLYVGVTVEGECAGGLYSGDVTVSGCNESAAELTVGSVVTSNGGTGGFGGNPGGFPNGGERPGGGMPGHIPGAGNTPFDGRFPDNEN